MLRAVAGSGVLVLMLAALQTGRSPVAAQAVTPVAAPVATPGTPAAGAVGTPAAVPAVPVEPVWQTHGGPDLPLGMPGTLALNPPGNLWVTDGEHSRFLLFAPDGTFLETWGIPGKDEGQFDFVRDDGWAFGGVAFGSAGTIYVVDTGNLRVQQFDPDRRFVRAWGGDGDGDGDGQFRDPIGIAIGPDGRVYVVDDGRNDVQVFAPDGTFLARFAGPGAGDGQLLDAGAGIAVDRDGTVLVADYGRDRLQRFGPDGTFLAAWGESGSEPGQFDELEGLAVDRLSSERGRVYVVDHLNHRVQVFAGDGRFLAEWGGLGSDAGEFIGPVGIALGGDGNVYVNDYNRVQMFRLLPPLAP